MKTNYRLVIALSAALGMGIVACDGSRSPTNPTVVSAAMLLIEGPLTVAPGESAQFRAIMQSSDGSRRDVTAAAAWTSSNTAILTVSASGVGQGHTVGEVAISASFESKSGVKQAMVIPTGTFRLTGVVRDAARPVGGAQVTVTGPGITLSTVSDPVTGAYRVYGASGDIEIRAARDGYLPSTRALYLTDHATVNFSLTPEGPTPIVAGDYLLTITAAPSCTALPSHVRTRNYTARLEQNGSQLTGTLGGAQFYEEPWGTLNRFAGGVQPGRLALRMAPPFDIMYFPEIFEIVTASPPTYVALIGDIVADRTSDGYAGILSGSVEFWTGFQRTASCLSSEHGFVLRPASGGGS